MLQPRIHQFWFWWLGELSALALGSTGGTGLCITSCDLHKNQMPTWDTFWSSQLFLIYGCPLLLWCVPITTFKRVCLMVYDFKSCRPVIWISGYHLSRSRVDASDPRMADCQHMGRTSCFTKLYTVTMARKLSPFCQLTGVPFDQTKQFWNTNQRF